MKPLSPPAPHKFTVPKVGNFYFADGKHDECMSGNRVEIGVENKCQCYSGEHLIKLRHLFYKQ